jgi:hypothetical protein
MEWEDYISTKDNSNLNAFFLKSLKGKRHQVAKMIR